MAAASSSEYTFTGFEIHGMYLGGGHDLKVGTGSVTGTMTGVGCLTISDLFNLGNGSHSVKTLSIEGIFDLKAGATLQLTNDSLDTHDIEVRGELWIAAAADTGMVKKDELGYDIDTSLLVDGGIVKIYKAVGETEHVYAGTTHTALGAGGGVFIVEEGIIFTSGSVTGDGNYTKSGSGTHIINGIAIDGNIIINDGTTTLFNVAEVSNKADQVFVQDGAVLDVSFGSTLEASMITVQDGGTMTNAGTVATGSLMLNNGTLELNVTFKNESVPMITTGSLALVNNAKINVIGGQNQQTYENLIEVTGGVTSSDLAKLNTNQKALYRTAWTTTNNTTLDLLVQTLTVKEYANEIGWKRGNVSAVAGLFDAFIFSQGQAEVMQLFAAASMSSVGEIEDILQKMKELEDDQLQTALRAAMAGELVGNAARMVMGSPQRTLFRQLDALPTHTVSANRTANRHTWGQAQSSPGNLRLWFNPYAQSEKGDADDTTYDGYSLTRAGFMIGGDTNLTNQIVAGLAFHYGSPNVKSDLGKITADDYMIGAYMKVPLFWQIMANGMIAYGTQKYSYDGTGGTADFDGNTIFGSLEFSRPFAFLSKFHLTPLVGLDFQSIGMDDLAVRLPHLDMSMPISPDGLDTVMVRLGLQGECFNIRSRVQYIRQVGGDDFMSSAIRLDTTSASVRSVQWGKDWVNVGLGYDFVQVKNFRLSADYDLDMGKNVTSHLGSVSAVLTW